MYIEDLFNPFGPMIMKDLIVKLTVIPSDSIITELVRRYNDLGLVGKYKMLTTISAIQLTMSPTEQNVEKNNGDQADSFIGKYWLHLVIGVVVLALVCVLLYFYGGYVHYLLTWPYHLLCKMVGQTAVSTSMTSTVPHWLFPFVETTFPMETVIVADQEN